MRFENADEAERFWNAQKLHAESLADLRWFVGDENTRTRSLVEQARDEIRGVDRRVKTLEVAAAAAATTAGHSAGRAAGAKWAGVIVGLVELLRLVASATGHPLH